VPSRCPCPAGLLRQAPVSLTENLDQTLQDCPGRMMPGRTRTSYDVLRQVPGIMPDSPASFANSPSLVSRLTQQARRQRERDGTAQSRTFPQSRKFREKPRKISKFHDGFSFPMSRLDDMIKSDRKTDSAYFAAHGFPEQRADLRRK